MNRARRSSLPLWVAAFFVAVVLYPLSIGPAVWLQRHGYLGPRLEAAYGIVYGPVSWLVSNFRVCRYFADWYIGFWTN